MNKLSRQLLYNKYVLIFIFILAIGNIIQFVSQGDYFSTAVLILVGFLTSFFSKNMVVIMVIGMVVANVLKFGTKIASPWKEGFENQKETKSLKEEKETKKEENSNTDSSEPTDTSDTPVEAEENDSEDSPEEEFTTELASQKKMSKKEKQKLIESDALDDLRAEMKIGFKRLNQNIDSIQTMGFFN